MQIVAGAQCRCGCRRGRVSRSFGARGSNRVYVGGRRWNAGESLGRDVERDGPLAVLWGAGDRWDTTIRCGQR